MPRRRISLWPFSSLYIWKVCQKYRSSRQAMLTDLQLFVQAASLLGCCEVGSDSIRKGQRHITHSSIKYACCIRHSFCVRAGLLGPESHPASGPLPSSLMHERCRGLRRQPGNFGSCFTGRHAHGSRGGMLTIDPPLCRTVLAAIPSLLDDDACTAHSWSPESILPLLVYKSSA